MRTAFIQELIRQARLHPEVFLVVGDLGFSVVESFRDEFPDRFLNVGVAEQNMTGVAAGLASEGYHVFTYSIADFPTLRCLEQIRNDVCYHNLAVTIVAVGGGVAYGTLGYSHHAVEDFAVMRALPNMTVVAPADPVEVRLVTGALVALKGPSYLRLGKTGESILHVMEPKWVFGRAMMLRAGGDVVLVSAGDAVTVALKVGELLEDKGVSAGVLSMVTVNPLDQESLVHAAETAKLVVVVESHGSRGGLSDAVARCISGCRAAVMFFTLDVDTYVRQGVCGSRKYLSEKYGLNPLYITEAIGDRLSALRGAVRIDT